MKKKPLSTVVISAALASLLTVSVVLAKFNMGEHGGGKYKTQAGQSDTAHLYLFEKDPDGWNIVKRGAWGKMRFNFSGSTFDFVFNGHGLESNTNYTLIYYADPWPGDNPGAYIANGTANPGGNIHLRGSIDLQLDLPDLSDENYPDGAKIWLVLSSDYDAENKKMTAWNPTEYLFEHNLITYDDTDV